MRLTMLLARFPARLPEYRALPARFDAWLNLSQREKARVFVMVRVRAMATKRKASSCQQATSTSGEGRGEGGMGNSPTSGSHMNLKRRMARMARATQRMGWE